MTRININFKDKNFLVPNHEFIKSYFRSDDFEQEVSTYMKKIDLDIIDNEAKYNNYYLLFSLKDMRLFQAELTQSIKAAFDEPVLAVQKFNPKDSKLREYFKVEGLNLIDFDLLMAQLEMIYR